MYECWEMLPVTWPVGPGRSNTAGGAAVWSEIAEPTNGPSVSEVALTTAAGRLTPRNRSPPLANVTGALNVAPTRQATWPGVAPVGGIWIGPTFMIRFATFGKFGRAG